MVFVASAHKVLADLKLPDDPADLTSTATDA
jgi:hypothetical protein